MMATYASLVYIYIHMVVCRRAIVRVIVPSLLFMLNTYTWAHAGRHLSALVLFHLFGLRVRFFRLVVMRTRVASQLLIKTARPVWLKCKFQNEIGETTTPV